MGYCCLYNNISIPSFQLFKFGVPSSSLKVTTEEHDSYIKWYIVHIYMHNKCIKSLMGQYMIYAWLTMSLIAIRNLILNICTVTLSNQQHVI